MRRTCLVALLLAVASFALLPAHGQAPDPARRYALLVGVRTYKKTDLRNLKYTENDVTALAGVLRTAGYRRVIQMTQTAGAENATLLPTAANIRDQLKGMLEDRDRRDTVLIAFSGHGVQFEGEKENYFCPMDATLADRKTLVSLTEVYDDLKKSGAGVKVLLVDACRNDPQSDLSRSIGREKLTRLTRPQAVRPPGGVAALFSSSEGQKSYEDDDLKHGIFFHFVIQGLKGKAAGKGGSVDLVDVFRYVRDEVPDYVKEHIAPRERQVPHLIGDVSEKLPLLTLDVDPPTRVVDLGGGENLEMVLIPAGSFEMGSPNSDKDARDDEKPQHPVRISQPFYLGKYEVTVRQFQRFVTDDGYQTEAERDGEGGYGYDAKTKQAEGRKPLYTWRNPGFTQGDDHPVVNVSWNDVISFCKWLSKRDGRKYVLPTEAQWEHAARAKTTTRWHSGDNEKSLQAVANIADASFKKKYPTASSAVAWDDNYAFTAPVNASTFKPNGFGLYHVHGNVWEWCADWYDREYYKKSPQSDPTGPNSGVFRVVRGAPFDYVAGNCRSAYRGRGVPTYRDCYLGFRVVCVR